MASYKKLSDPKSLPNRSSSFTIEDEHDEIEGIELQAVDLNDATSRHGLTSNFDLENTTQNENAGQSLFDICSGLSFFSIWNTLTFGWMDPLLRKGSKKALELSDLLELLPADQANTVYQRFRTAWTKQLDVVQQPSLVAALAEAFGQPFFFAGCIKLCHDSSLFLGPLLLNRIIRFLSEPTQPMSHGFILVASLFLVNLCQSLCLRQYFWLCFRTGMNLRAAVVTAVYAKTMVISTDALAARTTGEITNLMSVDAGRLQELTPYLHAVWYSLFQIVLAMYFLWQEMGISCLAGILVIICMIPISNRVSFYMKSLQKTISKTRDERVKITNEVLSGMKVLKLQAWEKQFQLRILAVRDKELAILKKYATAQCLATGLYTAIPLLVALTTFTSYLMLGHTLDIATALTSLALFELLRFPLFMLPQVVNNVVEALVSVERISSYLVADEQTHVCNIPKPLLQSQFDGCGVSVTDATFIYETALSRSQLPKHLQLLSPSGDKFTDVFIENNDDQNDSDNFDENGPAFQIQSFIRRPPRRTDDHSLPRASNNWKRFIVYMLSLFRRFVFWLHAIFRCSDTSNDAINTHNNNHGKNTKKEEEEYANKMKRPLSASEKALLVNMALLRDAEERLLLLEHQLQQTYFIDDKVQDSANTIEKEFQKEYFSSSDIDDKTIDKNVSVNERDLRVNDSVSISLDTIKKSNKNNSNKSGDKSKRLLPLRHISIKAKKGQLVAIVGAVGSGKSSLLLALLGQLKQIQNMSASVEDKVSETNTSPRHDNSDIHLTLDQTQNLGLLPKHGVCVSGNLGYCAQIAFIRNATLKDNILFHRPFHYACYRLTIYMCCLEADLTVLPAGDLTEIGEKGINLSGGQKARVSLARAVYGVLLYSAHFNVNARQNTDDSERNMAISQLEHRDTYLSDEERVHDKEVSRHLDPSRQTHILLLDDPLAAVDAHVGRHLFERCLLPLVRDRYTQTCILWVTNALQFTRHCDTIVVLQNGHVAQQGSYETLLSSTQDIESGNSKIAGQVSQGSNGNNSNNAFQEMMKAMNAAGAAMSLQTLQSVGTNDVPYAEKADTDSLKNVAKLADSNNASGQTHNGNDAIKDKGAKSETPPMSGQLVAAENTITGDVSRHTYVTWATAAGGVYVLLYVFCFFVVGELITIFSSYWLSLWSQHNTDTQHLNPDRPSNSGYFYLSIYGLINACVIVAAIWREYYLRLKGLDAAKNVFESVLAHVLYAPMSFFDTTPLGRVTNRLSKDIYTLDEQLPGTVRGFLVTTMRVSITLCYVSVITPLFLLLLLPLGAFYYLAQRFYIKTSRELTRLESTSRSPIYALFSETLDGLVTLRAYRDERASVTKNESLLNDNVRAYFCNFSANCWLAVRLEFVGTLIVMGAALFAVVARDSFVSSVDPQNNHDNRSKLALFAGLAGLSISLSMSITQSLNWTVRMASDLESQMVAVERLQEYAEMTQEKAHYRVNDPPLLYDKQQMTLAHQDNPLHETQQNKVWPSSGKLSFFNVSLRYRPNLPLVLQNVSFTIQGGEKVGVVGRTGAGKSSLLVALLRLVDPLDSGHIYLDDLDIGQLGLHVLRANIAVIPQDPVLFSGTVRDNLDPFHKYSDVELNLALERCHLLSHNHSSMPSHSSNSTSSLTLDDTVSENGSNFSVGQRQLLCIARALVSQSRVILLDEATAAVDVATDALIQQTIRQQCQSATVLTIAHRLNTILDSDRVLVLQKGQVAEFDSPQVLLQRGAQHSLFAELVQHWEETEKE